MAELKLHERAPAPPVGRSQQKIDVQPYERSGGKKRLTSFDSKTSQGIDEATWEQERTTGRLVFMTLYVFNQPVNALPPSDLQKIATVDGAQVIGCHKIVGSVYEPDI